MRAFDGRARFDADLGVVRVWLYGIAANLLRERARGEEHRLRAYARSGVDPVTGERDGVAAHASTRSAGPQRAALRRLPAACFAATALLTLLLIAVAALRRMRAMVVLEALVVAVLTAAVFVVVYRQDLTIVVH